MVNQVKAFFVREFGNYFIFKLSLFAMSPVSVWFLARCLTVDSLVSLEKLVNFISPRKLCLSNVFYQRWYENRSMETRIKDVLGQILFEHIIYVIFSPKVILLDILKHLVNILISLYHYEPRIMLAYEFFVLPI